MDITQRKCIPTRNECAPPNIISLYTDNSGASYYVCGPPSPALKVSASVIVLSADVKGYQGIKEDLRVLVNINLPNTTAYNSSNVTISFSALDVYDGSALSPATTFNDLNPLDLLP